jgi:hypothetical protein
MCKIIDLLIRSIKPLLEDFKLYISKSWKIWNYLMMITTVSRGDAPSQREVT